MNKRVIIIAAVLFIAGAVLFVGVLASLNFNFDKLDGEEYETHIYSISDSFENITVDVRTADITFAPSETEACSVEIYEGTKVTHSCDVKNGDLVIKAQDNRKWHDHFGLSFERAKIKVYLPSSRYAALSVHTVTGDTVISDGFDFDSVSISATTGNIMLDKASISDTLDINLTTGDTVIGHTSVNNNASFKVTTGDIRLSHFTAGELVAKATTGDIMLDYCDANEIEIKATTGDVKCALLSEKIFTASTTTGDVNVPHSGSGGKCSVSTTTGDIKISIVR